MLMMRAERDVVKFIYMKNKIEYKNRLSIQIENKPSSDDVLNENEIFILAQATQRLNIIRCHIVVNEI